MKLADVNVLLYAHRVDSPHHTECRSWLESLLNTPESYGVAELVLSGFVRIATHPRVFNPPSPLADALGFAEQIRSHPTAVILRPGARHWEIFTHLCRQTHTSGNLVADAYLAALAIEHGATWVTLDRDYSRFPGLDWTTPLTN